MATLDLLKTSTLFDRIINVTLYKVIPAKPNETTSAMTQRLQNQLTVPITCTDGGIKPSIFFSVNMVPNSVCYKAVLRITNAAFIRSLDIREYNVMQVEAGYRNANTRTFICPIFSAYTSKPNPDGEVTFEGLTVGRSGVGLLSPAPYRVEVHQDSISCYRLVKEFADKLGLKLDVSHCSRDILNAEIATQHFTATAKNGYAALTWLQNTLFSWGQKLSLVRTKRFSTGAYSNFRVGSDDDPIYLNLAWIDDTLFLFDSSLDEEKAADEDVIELKAVKNASFAGPALTVTSMYVPDMEPGKIFKMPVYFFQGGPSLPNVMSPQIFNPDDGLYRCITMSVEFSTVGDTNEMRLMGVPVSSMTKDPGTQADYATAETLQRVLNGATTDLSLSDSDEVVIKFGDEAQPVVEDVPPTTFWDTPYNPASGVTYNVGQKGWINFEAVGRDIYGTSRWKVEIDDPAEAAKIHDKQGVPKYFFFPLCILATYKRMNQPGGNTYFASSSNPDLLRDDKNVFVPTIDFDSLVTTHDSNVANAMEKIAEYYEERDQAGYAYYFRDIALYIRKGHL